MLDDESLHREIDFSVEARTHGIVMPDIASKFHVLCEDERKRIAEIVVEETRRVFK